MGTYKRARFDGFENSLGTQGSSVQKTSMTYRDTEIKRQVLSGPHDLQEKINSNDPVAVFIIDQSFPPILATGDGTCAVAVWVEDGRLLEIEKSSKDIFTSGNSKWAA